MIIFLNFYRYIEIWENVYISINLYNHKIYLPIFTSFCNVYNVNPYEIENLTVALISTFL